MINNYWYIIIVVLNFNSKKEDKMSQVKKEKWDGRSRISTETYKKNWNDIFGKEVTIKDLKNVLTEEEWTNKLLNKNGTSKKINRTTD